MIRNKDRRTENLSFSTSFHCVNSSEATVNSAVRSYLKLFHLSTSFSFCKGKFSEDFLGCLDSIFRVIETIKILRKLSPKQTLLNKKQSLNIFHHSSASRMFTTTLPPVIISLRASFYSFIFKIFFLSAHRHSSPFKSHAFKTTEEKKKQNFLIVKCENTRAQFRNHFMLRRVHISVYFYSTKQASQLCFCLICLPTA